MWRSKRKTIVAKSNVETELRSLANEVNELIWLKLLLEELQMSTKSPMRLYRDNKVTISMTHNPIHHDRVSILDLSKESNTKFLKNDILWLKY